MTDGLAVAIRRAYEGSADSWAEGPSLVYRRLATALVDASPEPFPERPCLDLGAGTGVASEVLEAAGARPVGVDLAEAMVRHPREDRPPGVVGDALCLPFRDGVFDAVAVAFSLNHLPDPVAGLRECRRVVSRAGAVLASTFPSTADHPAKAAVERVLEDFGYRRPPWYEEFKSPLAHSVCAGQRWCRMSPTADFYRTSTGGARAANCEHGLSRPAPSGFEPLVGVMRALRGARNRPVDARCGADRLRLPSVR